jgi:hypothetical protein
MNPEPAPEDRNPAPRSAPVEEPSPDDLPFAIYIVIKKILLE